jgi:hypothetical protein
LFFFGCCLFYRHVLRWLVVGWSWWTSLRRRKGGQDNDEEGQGSTPGRTMAGSLRRGTVSVCLSVRCVIDGGVWVGRERGGGCQTGSGSPGFDAPVCVDGWKSKKWKGYNPSVCLGRVQQN